MPAILDHDDTSRDSVVPVDNRLVEGTARTSNRLKGREKERF
ncbi:hypothetical protein [Sorangium sp. So ce887]